MSRCEYHTSRLFIPAKPAIAVRYWPTSVEHDPLLLLGAKAVVARRDQHARREPLDIPLPRARERLIEVVDVEHQPPLRRREHPEVRQMRIPAALHRQPGPRRRREIVRHDHRRPAIERERRDQHPPIANRHQLRHPRLRLALEQRDRIGPGLRRSNVAWLARGTSDRAALPRATRSATDKCGTGGPGVRFLAVEAALRRAAAFFPSTVLVVPVAIAIAILSRYRSSNDAATSMPPRR